MSPTDRPRRIYLDHASTSYPKRDGMIDAMTKFMRECGSNAGRASYRSAQDASAVVRRVRRLLAEQVGAASPDCISFHSGCTAALNVAIHGLVEHHHKDSSAGPLHVIISDIEHNAVIRSLSSASRKGLVDLHVVRSGSEGFVSVDSIAKAITDETRLIALAHASNVTGCVQPVEAISDVVNQVNATRAINDRIRVLCDAAQTFGYLPCRVNELGVDILAAPAHKGSGGPTGVGMLYLHPELHDRIETSVQGGTGGDSLSSEMPTAMPQRLEAGTLNVAAIAGWEYELTHVGSSPNRQSGPEFLERLSHHLYSRLHEVNGIRVIGSAGPLPIASFEINDEVGLMPHEVAAILDEEFGVEVRAGYHCAAEIHASIGTRSHGTLRLSAGHDTTLGDIDLAIDALKEVIAG